MRSHTPRSLAALLVALSSLVGCSLVRIEFPETPLADHDVNMRVATHRFVERFSSEVRESAEAIAEQAEEEPIVLDALRWKIGATTSVGVSAFQTSPRDALVDTWAYCVQMAAFYRDGAGSSLFGPHQGQVVETASALEADVARIASLFARPGELTRYQEFVAGYSADHPLEDILMPRASAVDAFYAFMGIDETVAIETVGTLGQVLSDFGSRIGVLGDQLPQAASWRTELFLREQGVERRSLQAELELFGARIERVAVVAEQTPQLVDSSLVRVQQEISVLIEAIGYQRQAAMEALAQERAIVVEALSKERVATLEELEGIGDRWLADALGRVQSLAGVVLFGLVALVLVLFGAPFGAGVMVGRLSKRSA